MMITTWFSFALVFQLTLSEKPINTTIESSNMNLPYINIKYEKTDAGNTNLLILILTTIIMFVIVIIICIICFKTNIYTSKNIEKPNTSKIEVNITETPSNCNKNSISNSSAMIVSQISKNSKNSSVYDSQNLSKNSQKISQIKQSYPKIIITNPDFRNHTIEDLKYNSLKKNKKVYEKTPKKHFTDILKEFNSISTTITHSKQNNSVANSFDDNSSAINSGYNSVNNESESDSDSKLVTPNDILDDDSIIIHGSSGAHTSGNNSFINIPNIFKKLKKKRKSINSLNETNYQSEPIKNEKITNNDIGNKSEPEFLMRQRSSTKLPKPPKRKQLKPLKERGSRSPSVSLSHNNLTNTILVDRINSNSNTKIVSNDLNEINKIENKRIKQKYGRQKPPPPPRKPSKKKIDLI